MDLLQEYGLFKCYVYCKKTGFKFGFVWPRFDDVGGMISKKYITIDSEENIFDKNFIQNHSYTCSRLPQTHSYDNCLGPLSLKNIQKLPFMKIMVIWLHVVFRFMN
ncbi:hypothetical protein B10525_14260 [Campylobacter jejuni]|nr:hypothetical protein B10525_14260 [Campylobacter jejuni]